MRCIVIVLCFFALHSSRVMGQDSDRFSITGQIRHRTEVDARDFNTNQDNPSFHLLRTRVGLGVAVASDVSAFIQAQDSRIFGGENPTRGRGTLDGSAPALDLHQAYFKVTNLFSSELSLKLGRQEMAYGNQRLVGAVGWSNVGRSFDAGVLSYTTEKAALDIFAAQLVGSTSMPSGQNFYGAYAAFHPTSTNSVDPFLFIDNNTQELIAGLDAGKSMLTRITTGVYVHGTGGAVDYELELIYQGGSQASTDSTALSDIKAYLLSGALGYTPAAAPNVHVGIQYTLLSGDKSASDNESNAFNTLFATNHKFYGFMDFFPATLPQQGLQDLAGSIALTPVAKLRLQLDVHHFMLAQGLVSGDDVFGQEMDFSTSYKYNNHFSLQTGLSAFFPGTVMEAVRGADTAVWFYLMSTVNF